MERQSNRVRLPLWHSLMYSTGFLLILCGIPGTVLLTFLFIHNKHSRLDGSEAMLFGGCMIALKLVIGGVLLFVAEKISKRRNKVESKNDNADA